MKSFRVTQSTDLKTFTANVYPQGSFALSNLLRKGDVKVNGVRMRLYCILSPGDEVVYYTTPAQEQKPSHAKVYEDENVYVADKADGVTSEGLFYELAERGIKYPVHRLDRNTKGVIILAKTKQAQAALKAAFANRLVEKIYYCIVKNTLKKDSDVLKAYLIKDKDKAEVKVTANRQRGAVPIVTEYCVVKRCGDCALVKVILHTGKTHQIRAHLAYVGAPVLGDTKYGDFALNKKYGLTRQQLVAKTLAFHLSGEFAYLNDITFTSNYNLPEIK